MKGVGGVGERQWLTLGVMVDFLVNMSASADVLAQAKVEIDLAAIPEGKNVHTPFHSKLPLTDLLAHR